MFRGGPDHLGVAGSTFPGVTTTDLNAWSRTTCQRGDSTDVAGIPIRQV